MTDNNLIHDLEQQSRRAMIRRIIIIALLILGISLVVVIAFFLFNAYTNARLTMREAKNIKLNLEMLDTEYYAFGVSIYDDTKPGNLRSGAVNSVKKIQGDIEGTIKLTGYNSKEHKITGLEYETEKYIVRFITDEDGEKWKVNYIWEILTYGD